MGFFRAGSRGVPTWSPGAPSISQQQQLPPTHAFLSQDGDVLCKSELTSLLL